MQSKEKNFIKKLKALNEVAWKNAICEKKIYEWLDNFQSNEKLEMLFLLSNFIYIDDFQIKKC